jgi:hypothetical protein
MILTLDNLATRYHMLPSQALASATTFDLYVLDISSKWVKYQQEQADLESRGITAGAKQPSQEEMLAMIERTRQQ